MKLALESTWASTSNRLEVALHASDWNIRAGTEAIERRVPRYHILTLADEDFAIMLWTIFLSALICVLGDPNLSRMNGGWMDCVIHHGGNRL